MKSSGIKGPITAPFLISRLPTSRNPDKALRNLAWARPWSCVRFFPKLRPSRCHPLNLHRVILGVERFGPAHLRRGGRQRRELVQPGLHQGRPAPAGEPPLLGRPAVHVARGGFRGDRSAVLNHAAHCIEGGTTCPRAGQDGKKPRFRVGGQDGDAPNTGVGAPEPRRTGISSGSAPTGTRGSDHRRLHATAPGSCRGSFTPADSRPSIDVPGSCPGTAGPGNAHVPPASTSGGLAIPICGRDARVPGTRRFQDARVRVRRRCQDLPALIRPSRVRPREPISQREALREARRFAAPRRPGLVESPPGRLPPPPAPSPAVALRSPA